MDGGRTGKKKVLLVFYVRGFIYFLPDAQADHFPLIK